MYRIKDLFTSLKYAYQRAVRYYDDMATYQFDDYLDAGLPALEKYCNDWLRETPQELNIKQTRVMKATLKKISHYRKFRYNNPSSMECYNARKDLWQFVGKNINGYWW